MMPLERPAARQLLWKAPLLPGVLGALRFHRRLLSLFAGDEHRFISAIGELDLFAVGQRQELLDALRHLEFFLLRPPASSPASNRSAPEARARAADPAVPRGRVNATAAEGPGAPRSRAHSGQSAAPALPQRASGAPGQLRDERPRPPRIAAIIPERYAPAKWSVVYAMAPDRGRRDQQQVSQPWPSAFVGAARTEFLVREVRIGGVHSDADAKTPARGSAGWPPAAPAPWPAISTSPTPSLDPWRAVELPSIPRAAEPRAAGLTQSSPGIQPLVLRPFVPTMPTSDLRRDAGERVDVDTQARRADLVSAPQAHLPAARRPALLDPIPARQPVIARSEAMQPAAPRREPRHGESSLHWRFLAAQSHGTHLGIVPRVLLDPFFPGIDLARVRVHTDEPADRAARSLRADAFALGDRLFFRSGRFNPATAPGLSLIGHELSHVHQLGREPPPWNPAERTQLERDAESVEATLLRTFTLRPASPPVQPAWMNGANGTVYPRVDLAHARSGPRAASERESGARDTTRSIAPVAAAPAARDVHPMKADEGRVAPAGPGITTASASPSDDPDSIMRAMFRTFERKIRTERERQGIDRWLP